MFCLLSRGGEPRFVLGLPHVMLVELRKSLTSYQDYQMLTLLLPLSRRPSLQLQPHAPCPHREVSALPSPPSDRMCAAVRESERFAPAWFTKMGPPQILGAVPAQSVLESWANPCGTRLVIRKGGKRRRTPTQYPSTDLPACPQVLGAVPARAAPLDTAIGGCPEFVHAPPGSGARHGSIADPQRLCRFVSIAFSAMRV